MQIVGRANIGLCLGAYRDLALPLHLRQHRRLKALVFCNDSNLLVQPPEALLAQLEQWTFQSEANANTADPRPVLAGLPIPLNVIAITFNRSYFMRTGRSYNIPPGCASGSTTPSMDLRMTINHGRSVFPAIWRLGGPKACYSLVQGYSLIQYG